MSLTANLSYISRGSFHDGTGVRTVVYFKGCGLRCLWCHNPETFAKSADVFYAPNKCISCGRCIGICPDCHKISGGKHVYDREKCTQCGRCAEVCPSGALALCGERKTVEEVFSIVKKDSHYYEASGGGVTLSGGECLLQAEFCAALLKKCRTENIGTAIETALFCPYDNVEKVLPYTDLIYADLKLADGEKHRRYTGKGNEVILQNLLRVSQKAKCLIVRIPVIPTVNDGEEDMTAFGEIVKGLGDRLAGVELLKYNYLAASKYQSLGKEYPSFADRAQTREEMQRLCTLLQKEIGSKCEVFFRS